MGPGYWVLPDIIHEDSEDTLLLQNQCFPGSTVMTKFKAPSCLVIRMKLFILFWVECSGNLPLYDLMFLEHKDNSFIKAHVGLPSFLLYESLQFSFF